MATIKYLQIDTSIFSDHKIMLLLRKYGSDGLSVYMFYLVEIARSSEESSCIPSDNELLQESGAMMMNISQDVFNDITDELIRIGLLYDDDGQLYSKGFNERAGKLIEANQSRSIKQKENHRKKKLEMADTEAKAHTAQPKPKKEPKPKPVKAEEEPAEVTRLKGYVDAIIADYPGMKYAKNDLTTEQYIVLLKKWGMEKLTIMQKVYFEWKFGKTEKPKYSDFGTLNTKGWVSERAEELLEKGYQSEPVNEPKEQDWVHPFPKPVDWDQMGLQDKGNYLKQAMRGGK